MPVKPLPSKPNLEHLKYQAKDLLKGHAARNPGVAQRIREFHPRLIQDLAEVRWAHQTRDEAMVLTVSTTRNAALGGPCSKSFFNHVHTCSNSILNLIAPIEGRAGRGH